MGCLPLYKSGNRVFGSLCGVRTRGKSQPPCACGRPGTLLCDGPRPSGKTCSRSICDRCSVALRAYDLDFCPGCAAAPADLVGCILQQLGPASSAFVRCRGAHVGKADLCLRHAVLFDHWHAFEGGEAVYASDLSREQKRDAHRLWLRTRTEEQLIHVLKARHALVEQEAV